MKTVFTAIVVSITIIIVSILYFVFATESLQKRTTKRRSKRISSLVRICCCIIRIRRHFEYYSYTDNYKDDIPVSFKVELNY